jgi:methylmalonyl-CoA/ethylmalonyl-CoA epimerase
MPESDQNASGASSSGQPSAPLLGALGQIASRVSDISRSIAFYRDTLGLTFIFEAPGLAFFQIGDVRLMLSVPESPEFDHPGSVLYLRAAPIEQVCETLRERGVSFESEPHVIHRDTRHELWMAFFRDPDRNLLALMEERLLSA